MAPEATINQAIWVYQQLRDLIVQGRLAPGSRVIEAEISSRLKVSRTPVRSALQRLQQEGYMLASGAGRQLRRTVAPLTREDAREIFGIVGEIEALGARWSAGLAEPVRTVLAGELAAMNAKLSASSQGEDANPEEVFDLHTRFHAHYMAAVGAPRLFALHRAIKPQAERYRRLYSQLFARESQVSADEHAVIISAIEAGELDGAQRAVQVNWRNAAARLARAIDLVGERGSW